MMNDAEEGQKCSRLKLGLVSAGLTILSVVVLGGLVSYISLFQSYSMVTVYILIIALSGGVGWLLSKIVRKVTDDDRQAAIASIFPALFTSVISGMVMKAAEILAKALSPPAGSTGFGAGIGLESIFSQAPNYLAVSIVLFAFFIAKPLVESVKKGNKRIIAYYLIAIVAAVILVVLGAAVLEELIPHITFIPVTGGLA